MYRKSAIPYSVVTIYVKIGDCEVFSGSHSMVLNNFGMHWLDCLSLKMLKF